MSTLPLPPDANKYTTQKVKSDSQKIDRIKFELAIPGDDSTKLNQIKKVLNESPSNQECEVCNAPFPPGGKKGCTRCPKKNNTKVRSSFDDCEHEWERTEDRGVVSCKKCPWFSSDPKDVMSAPKKEERCTKCGNPSTVTTLAHGELCSDCAGEPKLPSEEIRNIVKKYKDENAISSTFEYAIMEFLDTFPWERK